MAYRIKNPYKDAHILELNLMYLERRKSIRFDPREIIVLALPVFIFIAFLVGAFMPEFSFFAECANVPGGDICHISMN